MAEMIVILAYALVIVGLVVLLAKNWVSFAVQKSVPYAPIPTVFPVNATPEDGSSVSRGLLAKVSAIAMAVFIGFIMVSALCDIVEGRSLSGESSVYVVIGE